MKMSETGKSGLFGIFRLLRVLFSLKGAIPFTLLFILVLSIGAIKQSLEEESIVPFITVIGGKIFNYEQNLYFEAKKIQDAGGIEVQDEGLFGKVKYFFKFLKSFGTLIYGLWILYFFALIFYKMSVMLTNNNSAVFSNILLSLLFLLILETFFNFIIIDSSIAIETSTVEKFIPFRGLIESIKTIPLIFNPIYSSIETVQLLNSTLSINSSEVTT